MTGHVSLSREAVARLTANTEPWLSCDDCFDQVDAAVEALLGSTVPLAEGFRAHLLGCAACHEEAQSLAALVAEHHDLTAADAVARLDAAVGA
ncbi:hypothetical protein [Agromyces humatus]|uniref:Zinc-finger domain-containing protein n=1 Tax=Agromyces humatus TaxID=279573 RepID=A0ABP4WSY3_9MICO|nr:hypothetical protein [Agromyces humatus]